ncbi:MAG: sugar phosphate isomerase/epimerase family protein [Christensenellales bacterium]
MGRIKRAVSLYSFQDRYVKGIMQLEDMFAYLKENNCGMEILTDQMVPGAPRPTEETYAWWDNLMNKYQVTPVINDIFVNINLFKGREVSPKEGASMLIDELRMSKRLGFPMVRLLSLTPVSIIERALDEAEKLNITITAEIHGSMSFDNPNSANFIRLMRESKSSRLGLVIDTGIFCRKFPRAVRMYHSTLGTNEAVCQFVDDVYDRGEDILSLIKKNGGQAPDDLKKLYTGPYDSEYIDLACTFENAPINILDEYLPHVCHFHGKVYEMTENGQEYSISYPELIDYLKAHNYDGYIATEYEGNRYTLPGHPVIEMEQVNAHQNLLRQLLGE